MLKKLLLLGGLTAALTLALIAGGTTTNANPGGVQDFNVDVALCQVDLPDTVSDDP